MGLTGSTAIADLFARLTGRQDRPGQEITGEDIGTERLGAMSNLRREQARRRVVATPRPGVQQNTRTPR